MLFVYGIPHQLVHRILGIALVACTKWDYQHSSTTSCHPNELLHLRHRCCEESPPWVTVHLLIYCAKCWNHPTEEQTNPPWYLTRVFKHFNVKKRKVIFLHWLNVNRIYTYMKQYYHLVENNRGPLGLIMKPNAVKLLIQAFIKCRECSLNAIKINVKKVPFTC